MRPPGDANRHRSHVSNQRYSNRLTIAGVSGLGGIAIAAGSLRLFVKEPIQGFLSFLSQINEPAAWVLLVAGIAFSLVGSGFLVMRNQKLRAKSFRPR